MEGEKHTDKHLAMRKAGGYTDPVIGQIKADTQQFDCHGPAGTVVLWHTKILHIAGQTLLMTSSARRPSMVSSKRPRRFPTPSRWTTQTVIYGGIGPMKYVRNPGP